MNYQSVEPPIGSIVIDATWKQAYQRFRNGDWYATGDDTPWTWEQLGKIVGNTVLVLQGDGNMI